MFFASPSDTFIGLSSVRARCEDALLRFGTVGTGDVDDADVYRLTLERGDTKHELMLERPFDPERPRQELTGRSGRARGSWTGRAMHGQAGEAEPAPAACKR